MKRTEKLGKEREKEKEKEKERINRKEGNSERKWEGKRSKVVT